MIYMLMIVKNAREMPRKNREKGVSMVNKALEFATRAHEGQFRKGTKRPYIVHPIEVGDIVSSMTSDEEIISAAILHDTIEDCEMVTKDVLEREFSSRVVDLVMQESEDKTKTWMERKGATIKRLATARTEVQMIGLADKLSNMRDINRDYPIEGEHLWDRFRMKDKDTIGWYYKGIREALAEDFSGVPAYEEYCQLVEKNFG
jgi:myo-inositol-1(or 4)-monophosphatase